MVIYEWQAEPNRWKWVTWPRSIVMELSEAISTGSASSKWSTPELLLLDPIGQLDRGYADCLQHYSNHVKIISSRASNVLYHLMKSSVDVLDTKCMFGEYFAVNVFREVDCLDIAKSRIEAFPSGAIMSVHSYVCHSIPQDAAVFRMLGLGGRVFVTHQFVNIVEKASLTGFRFREVWRSELKRT